ncbi:hypothetical protein BH10CHL1_BH10CHL1_17830 [soil metagenome]
MLAQLINVRIASQRRDLYPNVNYSARYTICQTYCAEILHEINSSQSRRALPSITLGLKVWQVAQLNLIDCIFTYRIVGRQKL